MGRYDNISDEKLRYEIQRFARILQRMERDGETLDRTADILTLLGELRRMVFAWEVRCTFEGEDGSTEVEPRKPEPSETASERIVREAREQASDFVEGLPDAPEEEDDEGRDGDPGQDGSP
ncbi:MAG: hypothetical protein P8188_05660 [Gemmatimonadota bacterium]|jgi:hypothetical protein